MLRSYVPPRLRRPLRWRGRGLFDSKHYHALVFDFGDVDQIVVGAGEGEVAGPGAEDVDFTQDFSGWSHHNYGAFAVSGNVQVAVAVAAHSVKPMVRELADQSLVGQLLFTRNVECPDVALNALVDV